MVRLVAIIPAFSALILMPPANADGLFTRLFGPSFIQEHKAACVEALREELSYETGYQSTGTRSGFLSPDVFNAEFVASKEQDGDLIYFYDLQVEGIWHLATESVMLNSGNILGARRIVNEYLEERRIVDEYRVVRLGILSEEQAEPGAVSVWDRQHIDFRGRGNCRFYSEDSRIPHSTYIENLLPPA